MVTKSELHHLIDELPEAELIAAKHFLEYLRDAGEDPVARAMDEAPIDDEPVTPEDEAAIEEGLAAYRRGDYLTAADARRELLG